MEGPSLRPTSVTIMSPDPRALARFYSRLLDRPTAAEYGPRPGEPLNAGWAQIRGPEGELTLNFEFEREWKPPTWPAEPGTQNATQHLDIRVDDMDAAVEHALAAGATLAEVQPQEHVRVMRDPDGHPFCLFP